MIELKGKYNTAKVFTNNIDEETKKQITNYMDMDFVENNKVRIMPDTHAGKGSVVGLTQTFTNKLVANIVGVDIGCLDKDSEILTEKGWVKISEYPVNTKILQYNKNTGKAFFKEPLAYMIAPCEEFIHFKNSKGLDQMLSPEHTVPIWKGYSKNREKIQQDFKAYELEKMGANQLSKGYYTSKTTFEINSKGIDMSDDEIRLDIMIAADGCLKHEQPNGATRTIYMHFSLERKIKRCTELLNKLNLKYKLIKGVDGSTHIYFNVDKNKYNKKLDKYYKANFKQLSIIAEECLLWDGHKGYRSYFSSTNKSYADLIQFAFHGTNIRAGISITKPRNERENILYNVTPTKNEFIGVTNHKRVKSRDGKKYCFTTDTGYFIARRNGKIFITGNCGMLTVKLGQINIDFEKLDDIITERVPSGFNIHDERIVKFPELKNLKCYRHLKDTKRIERAIGTLGGGNHFIEVAKNEDGDLYLIIHSGSRNLGKQVAEFYQELAIRLHSGEDEILKKKNEIIHRCKAENRKQDIQPAIEKLYKEYREKNPNYPKDLCYLYGEYLDDYLHDVDIVVEYAKLNRETIAKTIVNGLLGSKRNHTTKPIDRDFHTIHNYVDTENKIIRKGAISAKDGEMVLIPLNMRDGSIMCTGKGNPDWNYSAPHGAGRVSSRMKARETLSMEDFRKAMEGIYTTSVCEETLDEAPEAYKPYREILENISDTVDIKEFLKPVYNFKAN